MEDEDMKAFSGETSGEYPVTKINIISFLPTLFTYLYLSKTLSLYFSKSSPASIIIDSPAGM